MGDDKDSDAWNRAWLDSWPASDRNLGTIPPKRYKANVAFINQFSSISFHMMVTSILRRRGFYLPSHTPVHICGLFSRRM